MITIFRVLNIVPTMGYGGIAMMMKNYAEELIKYGVVVDFIHHGKREDYHESLEQLGSHLFILPNMTAVGIVKYSRLLEDIICKNGPYDVIHSNMNYRAILDIIIAKRCGIRKRVIHVHGTSLHHSYLKPIIPTISWLMKKYGTAFLADSKECGVFYYRKGQFLVLPVSVNTEEYRYVEDRRKEERKRLGINENDFAIGHIAAFIPVKNHMFGLKVLKHLIKNSGNKSFQLFFAGDGELRSTIEKEIKTEDLSSYVKLLGNISDIPGFLSALDATMLPSLTEGLGQVLIQSQAAGVMSYASDTIPRESDMGFGLIDYLPIEGKDAIERWANAIRATEKNGISFEMRKNGIDKKGYSTVVSTEKLLRIYGGTHDKHR